MPSLPELHDDVAVSADAPSLPTAGLAPADVLTRVKTEGLRRRTRRHRRNRVLAALALAVVAVPVVSLLPGADGPEEVRVASAPDAGTTEADAEEPDAEEPDAELDVPAITVAEVPALTVPAPDAPVESPLAPDAPPVSLGPATVIERPAGPTCLNSTDPSCGEFRWDPQPSPNQPLEASFVDAPAEAIAGEPVTFTVQWADGDAQLVHHEFSVDAILGRACTYEQRYGPWTPPAAAAGSGSLTYTHTFTEPGTYLVSAFLATGSCDSPYRGDVFVDHTVTVIAATP